MNLDAEDRVTAASSPSDPRGQSRAAPQHGTEPNPVAPPGLPWGVALGDWDELLSAVASRLRLTVADGRAGTEAVGNLGVPAQVRADVLDCVTALEHLHMTLRHELDRRQQLEQEVFGARTALAQTRADKAMTQGDDRPVLQLTLHDPLTLLPNRHYFRQRLEHALAQDAAHVRAVAVLVIDLDGFKPVNDEHGDDIGDQVLRIVAARLYRAVRGADMLSRLGGDEFACLVDGVADREALCHLACKLFDAVSAPVKLGALRLVVQPSIGIAIRPAEGCSADALLTQADAAMRLAKRQQSGYAFHEAGPNP
jgi:diguanylate cyclase (GGDEF)-like protein